MMRSPVYLPSLLCGFLVLVGCSGRPARVQVPTLDPQEASAEALKLYDKNGDSLLDAEELKACPGLASCSKWVDTDSDGKLSAEEIAARVQSYIDQRVGAMSFQCTVTQGGRPLSGAEVILVPESFLGEAVQGAEGQVGPDGTVIFMIAGTERLGVQPGMYRVQVSKKNAAGSESLPAKFNEETTLGVEANANMLSDDEQRKTRVFQL